MKRLFLKIFWNPFERFCILFPLIPLALEEVRLNDCVTQIKITNVATKAISSLGGGYDYATLYLIKDRVLVDTGFSWAKRSLKGYILSRGLDQTLEYTINTHSHEDHIGNNDVIEQLTRSEIFAHPKAVAIIRHPRKLPWYRSFMFGSSPPSGVKIAPATLSCDDLRFEVLETPGHSNVCFPLFHLALGGPGGLWFEQNQRRIRRGKSTNQRSFATGAGRGQRAARGLETS